MLIIPDRPLRLRPTGEAGKYYRNQWSRIKLFPVTTQSAGTAHETVLTHSGATLPKRDEVDIRIVDATRNQKSYYLPIEIKQIEYYPFSEAGIVDLPDYEAGTPPAD